MKLVGLMPVRNEAWCIGLTARAALMWCDELVILDHASTDDTTQMLLDIQSEYSIERVHLLFEDDPQWDEMRHRQRMLCAARDRGASHISIIDADEILTGNWLRPTPGAPTGGILQLPGYNLRGGIDRYHSSGIWGNRWFSVTFEDNARLSWSGDKFHHREPVGTPLREYRPIQQGQGGVMHLWGASERRLKAKHALYKVTERLRWPDKPVHEIDAMYSWAIYGRPNVPGDNPQGWRYAAVPSTWWEPYAHLMGYLDVNAEPWQEDEVSRILRHHGAWNFQGLDLFGIV